MININAQWRLAAAAMVAAASVAACHNGGGTAPPSSGAPPPPPPPQMVDFSAFTEQAFAANANSTPVSVDGVNFTFDVNTNPSAFDASIMSGAFQ